MLPMKKLKLIDAEWDIINRDTNFWLWDTVQFKFTSGSILDHKTNIWSFNRKKASTFWRLVIGIFSVCAPPPNLLGAFYLHPLTHVQYIYIMIYYVMARAL